MTTDKMTQAGLPSVAVQPSAPHDAPHDNVEWTASPLRCVAHWVAMPIGNGRNRLEMVWEVPDPIAF